MRATLTNKLTGKEVRVMLKRSDDGRLCIKHTQYKVAIKKLGRGPTLTDVSFLIIDDRGLQRGSMDAYPIIIKDEAAA